MRIFSSLSGGLLLSAAMAQPCAGPQACFVPSGTGAFSVFFNNCSPTDSGSQFVWSFGDGDESTMVAPTHEFAAPGLYEVCLTGYWQDCVDSTCAWLTIGGEDPCAQLSANFIWFSSPNGVVFSNGTTGTGVSTSFVWSFGDGSTSNDAQPIHFYNDPGTYEACLLAISVYPGPDGMITCTTEHCALVQAGGAPPCDPNFAVALDATSIVGSVVQFTATSNHANTYFNWNFGDGTEGYGNTETHTFAEGGNYTVCINGWYYNELAQDSCWAEACAVITVEGGDPCAGLEACFQPSQLSETAIFFNNCSSPSLVSAFVWDFGDGSTSTSFAPIHTYPEAGTYWVCLTGTWPGGCSVEWCSELAVGGDPCSGLEACFVVNELPQSGSFFFDNCTQGTANTQFIWDFGDGGTSSSTNVDHHYAAQGQYAVCLTAYSQNCSDSTCTTITIGEGNPCDALDPNFSFSAAGSGVNFANTVITSAWSYLWNFGDGTEGDGPNPYHTYVESGTYQVCCIVYTWDPIAQDTCFADHCASVTVITNDPCDDLVACFVTNDLGNNSYFFDNCTNGPLGMQYTWDFGDGMVSTVTNAEHHFEAPGTYDVCLYAFWQNCVDTVCTEVVVGSDPCAGLDPGFTWTNTPNGTLFSNTTTGAGFETTFTWDFGDGESSSDAQPFHAYAQPGTYTVCLDVLTLYELAGDGIHTCFVTTCSIVTVEGSDPCNELNACLLVNDLGNNAFLFENCSSITQGAQFEWDFGDGTQDGGVIADHTYAQTGVYSACLTAFWQNCVDSTCTTVVVGGGGLCDSLVACFEPQPFENGVYFFSNCSQILPIDIPAHYSWDFGDGTTSDAIQPEHVFAPGTYTVCLTVAHSDCTDSVCTTIMVGGGSGCNPDFACTFTYDVQGTAVIFLGTANQEVNGVVWDLGDGTEGYTATLTHLYEPPGPFEVCLNAWYWNEADQDTCWAQYCTLVDPFSVGLVDATNSSINIYPIPANDVIHVSGLAANTQLQLFTMDGRLVFAERASSSLKRIPVTDLAPASYVLRLDMEGRILYRKVMVE